MTEQKLTAIEPGIAEERVRRIIRLGHGSARSRGEPANRPQNARTIGKATSSIRPRADFTLGKVTKLKQIAVDAHESAGRGDESQNTARQGQNRHCPSPAPKHWAKIVWHDCC